jgi:hypothetical protein
MIGYEQVGEACHRMDDEAVAKGLEQTLAERGIEIEGLFQAAEQRAIRIAMIIAGIDPTSMAQDRKTPIGFPADIRELLPHLQLAFVDGFVAGRAVSDPADRIQRLRGDT